ncbi:capsular polysaccharide biosynthesis protein [Bacillus sp. 17376]|uniref:Tyrosine-protein kinase transmembrane modulator EpsC n=1 Tax=Mesobacillus boroniphilus JCM 21738 TaxID=1294265 RepID=W4RSU5_9BACI|nr:Wzz/FepE/Etk N-terminal domain-containing protein [Mesobacillus boroniphilus]ESU34273.1 capsular polysaccharide biosynthesis protein [Bacillus sp. 17376]GAE46923.1 tyrosine-protein kinase transmembrane modulator EpsC [Mesobacillus boroniphilus JCM 21738]
MEETISLKELLQTLKKRLNLIAVITLLAVMVSGIISFFLLTPIYQASTQLLVNQSKNEQSMYSVGEVQTNLQLINTYNVIIKSPAILDLVIDELNLDMTTAELNGKISVQSEQNSQVVNISIQDADANRAAEIANKIAEVFTREITNIMKVDNVSILAKAVVLDNQSPIKPQPLLNIAIAMVVGLMAAVGLAFLLEYLDNTIKNEQDIEKTLGLPLLGVIAQIDDSHLQNKVSSRNERKARVRGESIGS